VQQAARMVERACRSLRPLPEDDEAKARRYRRTDRRRVLEALRRLRRSLDRDFPEIRKSTAGSKRRSPQARNRDFLKDGWINCSQVGGWSVAEVLALAARAGVKPKFVRWRDQEMQHAKGCPCVHGASLKSCAGRATGCTPKPVRRETPWLPPWARWCSGSAIVLRQLGEATAAQREAIIADRRLKSSGATWIKGAP
jgi:hypothetical protein